MNEIELEVFRAGDYGPKGRWTEAALDRLAANYDPALHEAPVTLDHAQSGPALGWVAALTRRGDRLVARLRGLSHALVALLRDGAFKKRSVELYRALPETGEPYLKAVSFLGAAAPEVKGLRDAIFTEAEPVAQFDADAGEVAALDFDGNAPDPADALNFDDVARELRRDGRWMPAWEARDVRAFFDALAAAPAFAPRPGETLTPQRWFADFLASLPPVVPFGEAAAASRPEPPLNGMITSVERASPDSIELHRRVLMLRESRPHLSYAQALREVARH
jgi:hypothetical protein